MKNKIRILYIDDDFHNRQIVKDTLQKEHDEFEIIETDNRIELELHLNKSDFDIVLSDINILGFDGLKVLQKIKEKKPETPVIIVTGNGSEEIAVEAMKLGAADYVIKSEKHIQNLISIIRKEIVNKKTQEEQDTTLTELRKSEERFRLLFDNSMDAVLLTEPDGAIHKINAAACNIFGRTEEEIKQIGRNGIFDITDPQLAIAIEEYSRTGKYKGELTGLRKDGSPFPIEISGSLFHDSAGNQRTSIIIRDISERKQAEKTQLNLSSRNEAILASVPEIIMEVDSNKIYTWANRAGIEFFGEDVIGKDAAWYFEGEQETYNLLEPLFNGTKSIIYIESRQRRCDGEKRTLAWWCRLLKDKDGKVTGALSAAQDITDRKRTEEALIASEIRYRRLFESANDGILLLNEETGVIVDVNPYLVELLGYSTEQFHEKKIWEIGIFSDIIANQAKFLELQQKEYVRYDDMPLKTSDGRQITVEFISNVYEVNHHKVIQCNIRDNTDRTNKQNEIKFQSDLINNVGQSVIATDLMGNVTYWNKTAEKIYGWSTSEAIGQNILNLTPAEQSNEQAIDIMKNLSEGKTWAGEFYVKRKDGSSFPAFVTDTPILDSNGKLTSIVGISSDISERKLSEELLIASEIRYRRLFESAKDGILILDAETGMIVDVNPYLVDLLGYSTEQFQGKRVWEIGVFSDIIANQAKFIELQQKEYVRYDDLPLKTIDGRHIDVEFVSNVYLVNKKKVIQCNIRDITERKLVEKDIRDIARFPSENPSPILRIAHDGTLLYVNEVGKEQLQEWKLQTGQPASKMLQDVVFKTLDKGDAQEVEFEHKEKMFLFYVVPYAEEGYANLYGRDITESKCAETKLLESEERFRSLYENSTIGIYRTTPDGKILLANPAMVKMTGFPSFKELASRNLENDGFQALYERKQFLEKIEMNGEVKGFESAWIRKDGTIINIRESAKAIRDSNGNILHYDGTVEDITNRKQAEVALRLSEEKFRVIFDNASDGMFLTDLETRKFFMCNATCARMLGHTQEEFPNLEIADLHLAEDLPLIYEQIGKFSRGEKGIGSDIRFKRKNGDIFFTDLSPTLITFDDKKFLLILFKDITERKKTEEQQIIQTTALEAAAFSVVITDSEGTITWVNTAFTLMTGYSKEEAIGKNPRILKSGMHDEPFYKNMWDTIKAGNVWRGEVFNKRKDSTILTDEMTITPVRDKNGVVQHFIALKQDITERKRISMALHESEQLLSKTQKFAHIGSYKYIINSGELIWSDEMYNIFGVPKDTFKLTPESFLNCIHQEDRSSMTNSVEQTIGGNAEEIDFRIVKPDGTIRNLLGAGNLEGEKDNKPLYIIGSTQDITERKQAEAEIRNLNTTLELKVEERTKKLSEVNIHLIEAKAQAEHANQAKSEFLSNMSHEIRTPMNAILGYAELLNNVLEDKTQKDYLKSIMSGGKTLLTLINDILDLSKIEAGKLELTFDYVNTHSFFSEFERIFSWKVEEKGLTFILDIVSGMPAGIYVDETRLRQIILNIIGNAVKFTQKGHIKLKVYIENPQIVKLSNIKSEEFIDLVIEVEDTGIGISSEFQNQIFEPFSQEQHKNQFGGTGLGLAITKRLLSLMNGTISLQSRLNKGSTFQLKIPNIAYLRDFERKTDSLQIDPATIVFEKATILIVDDIAHNRKYFFDAIKHTNIEVVEAEDGLTAYNLAKEIVPDLIITDLRMPKLDGFGLLKKIQGNAKLSHIPVIAYSASVMKEQKEHIFNCQFSGLLIKPVSVTDLYIELMNYLPYTSTQAIEKNHPIQKELLNQIIDRLGLIHSLETVYTDVWKKFEVRQPMDEVKEFGENLENLGNAHNAEIIKKYGNELMLAAESFNIESILQLLNKYQGIVNEIKEYQSTN